jgi:hypothetical protein
MHFILKQRRSSFFVVTIKPKNVTSLSYNVKLFITFFISQLYDSFSTACGFFFFKQQFKLLVYKTNKESEFFFDSL